MRSILSILIGAITLSGFSQTIDVSPYEEKLLNWQSKNISGRIIGTNTQKAYQELLIGKTPKQKVIVAVIDAGIDIYHEDLKENIWVNTNEISGNGIDDDNNGYIDDINGWNFLGNAKGENIDLTTLEKTRVYRNLKSKYTTSESTDQLQNTKEYLKYQKIKKEITKEIKETKEQYEGIKKMHIDMQNRYERLSKLAGIKISSHQEMKELEATSDEIKKEKRVLNLYGKLGLTKETIEEYYTYLDAQINGHLNENYTPRADIIGDDLNDINDRKYGNNNVTGPDAFHGTFCAGIIGATQNNNLGINGIERFLMAMNTTKILHWQFDTL
jgi:subtilisin family serine protease